jgi:hypothetical protein
MTYRLLAVVAALGCAQPVPAAESSVIERMKKDLYFLAGPECEGRGSRTQGVHRAADYIADQFKAAGLKPATADGSYLQPYTIAGPPKLGTPNTLTLTGPEKAVAELRYGTDFTPTALSAAGAKTAGVAFVGYGITSDKPAYDDYAGVDVKGRFVVVLRQGPRAGAKEPPFDPKAGNPHTSLADKLGNAVRHGAAGVLFVNHRSDADDALMEFGYAAGADEKVPVFQVKRAVLDKMLAAGGTPLNAVEDAIDDNLKPRSRVLSGWTAAAEASVTRPGFPAKNVVGVAEGSGPLANETVVIGAHYDHLGMGEAGSLAGKAAKGQVHFGADDNASGTTALIELARRFGGQKDRVGRRVVFAAFSGEEIGLLGSQHYCKNPLFPLESTVFMLNMDMVGRSGLIDKGGVAAVAGIPAAADGWAVTQRLVVSGTGTAEGLDAFLADATKDAGFKLFTTAGGTGPSDHDSFYRKKIPVLFTYTGSHRDYHRPSDTPDKIDYPGMERITNLVGDMAQRMAVAPDRPKYKATGGVVWDDPTDPRPQRSASRGGPRLGIMPGNYDSPDGGVLVDDLSPGGAAEKGGVKAGDVVVEIAGKPVRNINGYMTAMAAQKANQEIEVVVVRNDKRVTLKVTPQ